MAAAVTKAHTVANKSCMEAETLRQISKSLVLRRAMRLPYLASCSLALLLSVNPSADALELGEATVNSNLGQTLDVSIPFSTSGSERLASDCVSLVASVGGRAALPGYMQAGRISTSGGTIQIRGTAPVKEPLLGLNVRIDCNSAPHIVRSYQLFIDPAPLTQPVPRTSIAVSTASAEQAIPPRPVSRPAVSNRARGRVNETLTQGQAYQVRRGDTLSGIAARIAGRTTNIWDTVEILHATNPGAFTNGNVNLLEEGRTLKIPVFTATGAAQVVLQAPVVSEPVAENPPSVSASELDASFAELNSLTSSAANAIESTAEPVQTETVNEDDKPAFNVGSPFVVVDETQAESPSIATPGSPEIISRALPVADAPNDAQGRDSTWSGWLVGLLAIGASALLTFMLMLLMRRKDRRREDTADFLEAPLPAAASRVPWARTEKPEDSSYDVSSESVDWANDGSLSDTTAQDNDDFTESVSQFVADTDTFMLGDEQNAEVLDLALDAVSATTASAIDMDVGDAAVAPTIDASMISEAPVFDEPTPDTDVQLTRADIGDSNITIAELDLLTKDYEAEFTATQQMNQELAEAVADLARTKAARVREQQLEATAEMIVQESDTSIESYGESDDTAYFEEAEIRAELTADPAADDQIWDDSTRANALEMSDELLDNLPTELLPAAGEEPTAEMPARALEPTVEMPAAEDDDIYGETALLDDETQAMPASSGGGDESDDMWAELTGTNHRR